MASIFSYETEPIKVASPWPFSPSWKEERSDLSGAVQGPHHLAGIGLPTAALLKECGATKLEAEPQEGPIEYKLHLLLRPRRSFSSTSTVQKVSGSYLSKPRSPSHVQDPKDRSSTSSPALAPSHQVRQSRLQHLTTQLLWRLQQSSPHHSSSKSSLVLPVLPEADLDLSASKGPGPLIAGLQESAGAIYEIGVSDDGTLVGLTVDELEESLNVLRAMAFSLGCNLRVLRMVTVGDCQWEEAPVHDTMEPRQYRKEMLWVAEVLVAPHLKARNPGTWPSLNVSMVRNGLGLAEQVGSPGRSKSEQLRVSLIGSTTSGKSSLLGTLSTSTLDNGRGKSRLSLLKHRHEIVSGVTSSLAQELIGYNDMPVVDGMKASTNIVNYASGNVSSWTDIHNSSEPGRLVFVTDSAGHPKFRRTTVRGLLSWAPHWTLCCIAADDDEEATGRVGATASSSDVLRASGQNLDLSKAHLELCLKLNLPLVVVITKLDLATRNGLRQTVAKVLSTLKAAGRKPAILPNHAGAKTDTIREAIPQYDKDAVSQAVESVHIAERHLLVPIVLTSAVTGGGIGQVHALLRQLPATSDAQDRSQNSRFGALSKPNPLASLFHVDEVFTIADSHDNIVTNGANAAPRFILSGYLRYGSIETGDNLFLGPFASDGTFDGIESPSPRRASPLSRLSKSLPKDMASFEGSHHEVSTGLVIANSRVTALAKAPRIWHSVQVTSLRYLRLPVRKLSEGQVGTIAISPSANLYLNADPSVRRGMVLTTRSSNSLSSPSTDKTATPANYTRITAIFAEPNIYVNPGSSVTIYTASIRAPAKIVEVKIPDNASGPGADDDVFFSFDTNEDQPPLPAPLPSADEEASRPLEEIEITFKLTNSREWVEIGTKLLVTPASGISMLSPPRVVEGQGDTVAAPAVAPVGLDGFVGRIVGAS